MPFYQKVFHRILMIQSAHPWRTILVALLLAVLSIGYTVHNLEFLTSQMDLISPENRLVKLSEKISSIDKLDRFVVVIQGPKDSRSLAFLHALVPRLGSDRDYFEQVFYRVNPDKFRPWSLLYLDHKDLEQFRDNLSEHRQLLQQLNRSPDLNTFFAAINHEMTEKMVGELFTGFLEKPATGTAEKPLNLNFLINTLTEMRRWVDGNRHFVSPWKSFFSSGEPGGEGQEGYFWSDHHRYLLLFVTPQQTSGFAGAADSLGHLRSTIDQVKSGFPDIQVGVTGQAALDADEMGAALRDMSLATGLSLLGLTLLLTLFWRGFRRPLLEITELVIALSWTFGLTTLVVGHLNILSVTFAPLLLGLGIDYGIHWFARYQEEEERHTDKRETIRVTMLLLGPGILMAGITAAFSFFPLVLTGFRGLAELGIITFMGMLMTTVTTICVLPALTLVFDRPGKRARVHNPLASPGGTRYLLRLNNRRARLLILPFIVALGFSAWGALHVKFDLNMLNLQAPNAESVVWERKLIQGTKNSSLYGAILAHSLEEVRSETAKLKTFPAVAEIKSIASFLPNNQKSKIDFLQGLQPLISGIGSFAPAKGGVAIDALGDTLGRIRFKMLKSSGAEWGENKPLESQMTQVRGLIAQLQDRFRTKRQAQLEASLNSFQKALMGDLSDKFHILRQNMNARPMAVNDLPESIRARFITHEGLFLIRIFPARNIWQPDLLGKFVKDLRSVDADAIGDPVTLYIFTQAFRNACLKAAVFAVVFIVVLLVITFRRMSDVFFAMVPLVVGTILTLGLMKLFGINFNLANSLFLPLVVGAGVEYGIILVQRWRQGDPAEQNISLPYSTAKGVILAGLTTTIGFGSLTISHHRGIHSLGLLAMIGSLSILAAAVIFLPALMQLLIHFPRKSSNRPPKGGSKG